MRQLLQQGLGDPTEGDAERLERWEEMDESASTFAYNWWFTFSAGDPLGAIYAAEFQAVQEGGGFEDAE